MKKINTIRFFSLFLLGVHFIFLTSCFNNEMAEPAPLPVDAPSDYVAIAAGYDHTLALSNGLYSNEPLLLAWGNNLRGQLGDSTTVNKDKPIVIGYGYTAISAGGSHSMALRHDTLFAWGDNQYGQLGDGNYSDKNSPMQIGTGYSVISAGFAHSLALKQDGTLWAWGDNTYGQIGNGTNENSNTPVQIGSDFSSIAAGGRHSLALKTDGTLWAWGNNEYGQLGDGTNIDRDTPVRIGSGFSTMSYATIAAGGSHSLALKFNTLYAWGRNEFGQLGDGTNIDRNIPVKVYTSLLDYYSNNEIAAGDSHSLLLEANGVLWACGRSDLGQSGGDTYIDRNTLAQIGSGYDGLDAVGARIAAGGFHSFVLKEEEKTGSFLGIPYSYYINHLWAWGDNQYGQLGCGPFPKFTNNALQIDPN